MRCGTLGLGLPPWKGGDPYLALDLSFSGSSLPSIFTQERTGPGGAWEDDGDLGFGAHNYLLQSGSIAHASWTKRGTCSVSGTLVSGLDSGSGTGDVYQYCSSAVEGARYEPSFKAKQSSASGVIIVNNPTSGAAYGEWHLDLSLLSTEWERITRDHAAVTVVTEFVRAIGANGGMMIKKHSGTGTLAIYLDELQVNTGTQSLAYVATTTAARYLMRQEIHPAISPAVRGVLGEPQVTNGFWNSPWAGGTTPTNWTLTGAAPTVETSLHGTSDGAIALEFTAAAAQSYIYQAFTIADNTTYAISCLVESITGTVRADDVIDHGGLPAGCSVLSYYLDGVAATAATTVTVGELTMVIGGTYTGLSRQFRFGCGTNAAATGTVQLSRPQIEASTYKTSWIATPTGATQARTADPRLTYTLPAALQTALATAGTLFVEFAFVGAGRGAGASLSRVFATLSDGTSSNRISLVKFATELGAYCHSGGVGGYDRATNTAISDAYTLIRMAFTWDASSRRACVNGELLATTGTFVGCPVTQLALLGFHSGSATAGAIITRAKVYTRSMLANGAAELQALAHA